MWEAWVLGCFALKDLTYILHLGSQETPAQPAFCSPGH